VRLAEEYPIQRFEDSTASSLNDRVVTEARVELDVNDGQYRMEMYCLPQDIEAMAVGRLLSEGVVHSREQLESVQARLDEGKVLVRGRFDREPAAPAAAPALAPVAPAKLNRLIEDMQARVELWRGTGAVHACALADSEEIVAFAEDIGRHNAFDKVVGRALLDGVSLSDKLVLLTGRLTAEMVRKAVLCGVGMLVSRSAVTSLAINLGRQHNITLVGFVRDKRLNVYTGLERISGPSGRPFQAEGGK